MLIRNVCPLLWREITLMLVNEHESLANVLKKQKENIAKRQNNNYNNVCSQSNVPLKELLQIGKSTTEIIRILKADVFQSTWILGRWPIPRKWWCEWVAETSWFYVHLPNETLRKLSAILICQSRGKKKKKNVRGMSTSGIEPRNFLSIMQCKTRLQLKCQNWSVSTYAWIWWSRTCHFFL